MVEQKEPEHIVKYQCTLKKSAKNTLAYFGQHSDNVSMLKIFFVTDGGAKGTTTYCQISHYPEKVNEKHSSLLWSA
jgi:hypothetical protein